MTKTNPATKQGHFELSYKDAYTLSDLWKDDFHTGKTYELGNTARWWEVLNRFLRLRGDELIPASLRSDEERVMALGKSQEYLAALAEVVVPRFSTSTGYDETMLVVTASAAERAEALKKVLA